MLCMRFRFASKQYESRKRSLKKKNWTLRKICLFVSNALSNRVAYHFMIDPDLEKIEVPKFVIQPLVENYFKHGIDFTRFDNALSVKVLQEGKRVRIIIKDNGKGMTEKRLKQIEENCLIPKWNFTVLSVCKT